jgi:hypothetical protein
LQFEQQALNGPLALAERREFALPNYQYMPALPPQASPISDVTAYIGFKFYSPKFLIALRR